VAKAVPTRTIGPLHLEDLEPHRFEDLVRQLVYDFRSWRQLEATGRPGGDAGFDARGFEGGSADEVTETDEDSEKSIMTPQEERVWLIQCKREKQVTPKKLLAYLADIPQTELQGLYGIIFAAACDFSKAARDAFRSKVRETGVAEAHLWGKAEIEDMLFQPKNDYLLFAYCGISLQARKRSLRTDIRARIATKRKAVKAVERYPFILVRDASDERYPFLDGDTSARRIDRGHWRVYRVNGCYHDGVRIHQARHHAYLSDDGTEWDFAETVNLERTLPWDDPWATDEEDAARRRSPDERYAETVWRSFPENNRVWLEVEVVLPYEAILAVDEDGDDRFKHAHFYTATWHVRFGPFSQQYYSSLKSIGAQPRGATQRSRSALGSFSARVIQFLSYRKTIRTMTVPISIK
jgi:hypothetical protein